MSRLVPMPLSCFMFGVLHSIELFFAPVGALIVCLNARHNSQAQQLHGIGPLGPGRLDTGKGEGSAVSTSSASSTISILTSLLHQVVTVATNGTRQSYVQAQKQVVLFGVVLGRHGRPIIALFCSNSPLCHCTNNS